MVKALQLNPVLKSINVCEIALAGGKDGQVIRDEGDLVVKHFPSKDFTSDIFVTIPAATKQEM